MALYPIYHLAQQGDNTANNLSHKIVTNFVDSVRTKGYITSKMYSEFIDQLHQTGNVFDIEMEHLHKKYNPVYADPADPASFQDSYDTYYDGHYTEEILKVLFPANTVGEQKYYLNTNDIFNVTIKNRNRTMATQMRNFFTFSVLDDNAEIYIPYGGMVLNEDH